MEARFDSSEGEGIRHRTWRATSTSKLKKSSEDHHSQVKREVGERERNRNRIYNIEIASRINTNNDK